MTANNEFFVDGNETVTEIEERIEILKEMRKQPPSTSDDSKDSLSIEEINQRIELLNEMKGQLRQTQGNMDDFIQLRGELQRKNVQLKKLAAELPDKMLSHKKGEGTKHYITMTLVAEEIKVLRTKMKDIENQSKALRKADF